MAVLSRAARRLRVFFEAASPALPYPAWRCFTLGGQDGGCGLAVAIGFGRRDLGLGLLRRREMAAGRSRAVGWFQGAQRGARGSRWALWLWDVFARSVYVLGCASISCARVLTIRLSLSARRLLGVT